MERQLFHQLKEEGQTIGRLGVQLCGKHPPKPRWTAQLLERLLCKVVESGLSNALLLASWGRPSEVFVQASQEQLVKDAVYASAKHLLRECPELVVRAMVEFRTTGVRKAGAALFKQRSGQVQDAIVVALDAANRLGLPLLGIPTDGCFLAILHGHRPPPSICLERPDHLRNVLTATAFQRLHSKATQCPAARGPWVEDFVLQTEAAVLLPASLIPDASEIVLCNCCYRAIFPTDVGTARCQACFDVFECDHCRRAAPLLKHDCNAARMRAGEALVAVKRALPSYPVLAVPTLKGGIFCHASLAFGFASTICNAELPMAVVELYQQATRCQAIEPEAEQDDPRHEEDDKGSNCCFDALLDAMEKKKAKKRRQKEKRRQQRLTEADAGGFEDSP